VSHLAHPALAMWFAIGLGDWLVNLAFHFVLRYHRMGNSLALLEERLKVSRWTAWVIVLAIVLGPIAVAMTAVLMPRNLGAIKKKRAMNRAFDTKCGELEDDCVDLIFELSHCSHEGMNVFCNDCGATLHPNGWIPPRFVAQAKQIANYAAAEPIVVLRSECPPGAHE